MNIFELIIVQPVFNLLTLIFSVVPWGDFGIALIIFTVLVRFALYPLVRKQLHQTKMMRKLQPQLAKIKKSNKGDRRAESMQMMDLYKTNGVSPFRSIGILIVQLPILIGLFLAVRVYTDSRDRIGEYTYDFLENFQPVAQLVQNPDQFNQKMLGFIDLTKHAISADGVDIALVSLAVLAAVTQYIMSKQTMPHSGSTKGFKQIMSEAAAGKQADQSEMNALVMQNMVKILPFFMFFVMINLPGALALYYTVSNLVAVGQQSYLLRQDEEELEEIASEAPVVKTAPKKKSAKATKGATAAKQREKKAKKANVTRITAKDNKSKAKKAKG